METKIQGFQPVKNTLELSSFLKPTPNYDKSSFKPFLKSINSALKNNQNFNQSKKAEYNKIIKNNFMIGSVLEIFESKTEDSKLVELLSIGLAANVFSKFDETIRLSLVDYNDVMNMVFEDELEKYNSDFKNEFDKYFKQSPLFKDKSKELNFKLFETYEFKYQWNRIYSIVTYFFKKIGQDKLGQSIAQYFLLSYESKREIIDLNEISLVMHESLSENFLNNKQIDLLSEVFYELNHNDSVMVAKIMIGLTSITNQFTPNEKTSKFSNIFMKKNAKEKFRLYCSNEIIENLSRDLKYLKNYEILNIGRKKEKEVNQNFVNNNSVKINNKIFTYKENELNEAIKIFKNIDQIDYLAALSESFLRAKHLTFNKYHNHIEIIKLANLAYYYPILRKEQKFDFSIAKNIFEILMLQKAYLISEEFGNEFEKLITSSADNVKFFSDEIQKGIDADRQKNWTFLTNVCSKVIDNLSLNTKVIEKTVNYYIFKREIYGIESTKDSKSILLDSNISFNELSKKQNDLIFEIEAQFKTEQLNINVKYIRFLTETFGKLYLSDKPPLSTSGKIGLAFIYVTLILWVLTIAYPVMQLIIQSFNWYSSNESVNGGTAYLDLVNLKFSLANFENLFANTPFMNWVINSIAIAGISMILMVTCVSFIGYAFSRFRFKGKRISLMTVMLIQMIPTISSFVVFYIMYQLLNIKFGVTGQAMLVIIYTGGGIPGNVFVLKGYLDNISTDIDDAAKIDGCGNFKIFTRIMLPLAKPMLSVIALWAFIGPFGDVLLPRVLLSEQKEFTMATGLQTLISGTKASQGSFAAGSLLVAVPITTMFILLQKNITGGLSAAGVKG